MPTTPAATIVSKANRRPKLPGLNLRVFAIFSSAKPSGRWILLFCGFYLKRAPDEPI